MNRTYLDPLSPSPLLKPPTHPQIWIQVPNHHRDSMVIRATAYIYTPRHEHNVSMSAGALQKQIRMRFCREYDCMRVAQLRLAFGALCRVFWGHIAVSWGLRPQQSYVDPSHTLSFHILLHLIVPLIIRLFYYTGHDSPPITSRSCLTQNIRTCALLYHLSLPLLPAIAFTVPGCQQDPSCLFSSRPLMCVSSTVP